MITKVTFDDNEPDVGIVSVNAADRNHIILCQKNGDFMGTLKVADDRIIYHVYNGSRIYRYSSSKLLDSFINIPRSRKSYIMRDDVTSNLIVVPKQVLDIFDKYFDLNFNDYVSSSLLNFVVRMFAETYARREGLGWGISDNLLIFQSGVSYVTNKFYYDFRDVAMIDSFKRDFMKICMLYNLNVFNIC